MKKIKLYLVTAFLKANQNWRKVSRWIWAFAIATVCALFLTMLWISQNDIPAFRELENPQYDEASIIYDANGVQFGKYYVENREAIEFKDINKNVKDALLATEDSRFFSHSGVDIYALLRVGVKTLLFQKESSGGGSTISQQLAKLLYKRPSLAGKNFFARSLTLIKTKLKEWVTAVKLEKTFTKEEIMAHYLNQFEFVNGAHGIQVASETYFNKRQDSLNIDEAATLVGMLKNPSLYNPMRFPEKSIERRNTVLSLMEDYGAINRKKRDSLMTLKIDMTRFNRAEQSDGPAPYFRAELTKFLQALLKEKDIKKSDGTAYNIYTDGLKVHTTIDLTYQKYAEQASEEHMEWLQKRYFKTWKGMNPWTYKADDNQKAIRKDVLFSHLKATDWYLSMRQRNIGTTVSEINRQYPSMPISDRTIDFLLKTELAGGDFKVNEVYPEIQKKYINEYKDLINSDLWTKLKPEYQRHIEEFQKIYATPRKMLIYDHELGEKEVEMTPMDSVKYISQHLQNAMLAVDPQTGYIKAWVGGINHRYFKYDHVTSRRSVGSTLKPFVYTCAMAVGGVSPCQEFEDIQYTIAPGDANFDVDKEWSPANATDVFTGNMYNLYHGLVYSKNSITVRLLKELGTVEVVRDLLDKVGISKSERLPNGRLAVPKVPSICLGAVDISLLQMTGAYTAFANQGVYTEPIFITSIEDKNGREIYTGVPVKRNAINPMYNAVMVDMLKNVVGGEFAMGLKVENGGKTGTTNDFADGWFMGITPNLVVGVWTGGDDKWIAFTNINDGQGYVVARPAYQKFIQKLEADKSGIFDYKAKFAPPPPGYYELIDCDKVKTIRPEKERRDRLQTKIQQDEFGDEFEQK